MNSQKSSTMKDYLLGIFLTASVLALGMAAPTRSRVLHSYQEALNMLNELSMQEFGKKSFSESEMAKVENLMSKAQANFEELARHSSQREQTALAAQEFREGCPLKNVDRKTFGFRDAAKIIIDAIKDLNFDCQTAKIGDIFRTVSRLLDVCTATIRKAEINLNFWVN